MNPMVIDVCATSSCCQGIRGNVDYLFNIDISDLVYLVEYQYNDGPEPYCFEEADVDASSVIDLADIVYMVEYMFNIPPGVEPKDCFIK